MGIQPLNQDGDGFAAGLDVLGGGGVGDAPVGPVVAADGGEAGLAVEELDAGFDPLARGRGGRGLGEDEDEAGLVELVGVGCGEGEGGGLELGKGVFGEGVVGGCVGVSKWYRFVQVTIVRWEMRDIRIGGGEAYL